MTYINGGFTELPSGAQRYEDAWQVTATKTGGAAAPNTAAKGPAECNSSDTQSSAGEAEGSLYAAESTRGFGAHS